jgi:TetR/AcrR family transcriptional repressor of nem operon
MNTLISRHTQTDTRKLIMRVARELLLTRSYLGLSFQELADRVGIRKASLYHHFASKEVLGIELMNDSQSRFIRWTEGLTDMPAAEQILAYIRMFRDTIGASQRVCAIGATVGEWDCIEPALQEAVRRFHRTQTDWLTQVASHLQAPLTAPMSAQDTLSAQQWAAQVNAICQGAMINARMHGDITVFDTTLAPLRSRLSAAH